MLFLLRNNQICENPQFLHWRDRHRRPLHRLRQRIDQRNWGGYLYPSQALSAGNYVTFLSRALDYGDSQALTTVDRSLITQSVALVLFDAAMDRMELVNHSYAALPCKIKEGFQTLAEKFRDGGIFTEADGTAAGVLEDKAGWTYE